MWKCLEQLNSKTSKLGSLEMCNFVTCQTFVSSSQTCHDVESSQALFIRNCYYLPVKLENNKKFVSLSANRGKPCFVNSEMPKKFCFPKFN